MNDGIVSLSYGGRLFPYEIESPKGFVIICPGGGYHFLSEREAKPIADAYNSAGYSCAILYYYVRSEDSSAKVGTKALQQLGEALGMIGISHPGLKVSICGFSAGAHLAASFGAYWKNYGNIKPNSLILCYPVISSGKYRHSGSFENLCNPEEYDFWSVEKHISLDFPPCFIWHTAEDDKVPVQNSMMLADALCSVGVAFELHVFPKGTHGLSLATREVEEPGKQRYPDKHVSSWFAQSVFWLNEQ